MNKKFTITLLGIASICALSTNTFATDGTVTASSVRIREQASTSSEIVESIPKDTIVNVISEEEGWYKVEYNGKEGYIKSNFLKVSEDENETTDNTTIDVSETEENNVEENNIDTPEEENNENTEEITDTLYSNSDIYLIATYSSSTIGSLTKGTKVEVEMTIGNWSYVSSKDVMGWIPNYKLMKEYEQLENDTEVSEEPEVTEEKDNTVNEKGYLSSSAANLREGPGTDYQVIGGVASNEEFTVLSEKNGWYKVKTSDDTEGYLLKSLVTLGERPVTSRSNDIRIVQPIDLSSANTEKKQEEAKQEETKKETSTSKENEVKKETEKNKEKEQDKVSNEKVQDTTSDANKQRVELVAYAMKYLGYKYKAGGASPKTGFDCSGFTQYVYGHFGYKLSRSSSSQKNDGTKVKNKASLEIGDLLLFSGHVGIYIGNNEFIHASNPDDGVKITSLSDSYYVKNYLGARRIIK